ncbi:hypothetical protein [Spirosoma rigui]|uniref:hypothetical protein n=1 Tax=Spirosoma rigui TaxID=564064 RepID=UPI0009AF6999|nr:hypothetical protein [Spirosoma rigui]
MEYQDRIVAFVDILGFRNLIKETQKEDALKAQKKLDEIYSVVKLINKFFNELKENYELHEDCIVTMFSDSIVISVSKVQSYEFLAVFEVLKKLQIQLVKYNILLRGGIVIDKLIHTENMIIGPGLIKAYDLESKSALYPRIVIDPVILTTYVRQDGNKIGEYCIRDYDYLFTFNEDFDGTYYIDYFNDVDFFIQDGNTQGYFAALNSIIENGISNNDIGIKIKYMWMDQKVKNANYDEGIRGTIKKSI